MKRKLWFAIDAGTTTAVACIMRQPREFHCFAPGDPDGDVLVGDEADWLVPCACLHLGGGRIATGRAAQVRDADPQFAGHVIQNLKLHARYGRDKSKTVSSNGREFTHDRVYGEILKALKLSAIENFNRQPQLLPRDVAFSGEINRAVLAVSSSFGPRERTFIQQAAQSTAGFSEVRLIDSPLAAVLGLGLHLEPGARNVLIVDVGGGTCDLMAVRVGEGVSGGIQELGRIGSRRFGGLDVDELIARDAIRRGPLNWYDWDQDRALRYGPVAPALMQQAERVKRELCGQMVASTEATSAEINWLEPIREKNFNTAYTTDWLRQATSDQVNYIIALGKHLLENIDPDEAGVSSRRKASAGISWMRIDEVHLVGGCSLMPPLQERLVAALGGDWNRRKLQVAERPQRVIAEGAAVFADMLSRGEVLPGLHRTRCPADIGIRGAEDDDLWLDGMRSFLPSNKKKDRKYVFHPMVAGNSIVTDGQTTRFVIPVLQTGSGGKINLSIYERFVKHPPVKEVEDPLPVSKQKGKPKRTGEEEPELEYSNRRLAKIKFRNLPELATGERDQITLLLRFTENQTVEFSAAYRRKTLTSRLFGDNFDHVFDFSGATGEAGGASPPE
jgi:molecular chaperone DnaK (HSP70)